MDMKIVYHLNIFYTFMNKAIIEQNEGMIKFFAKKHKISYVLLVLLIQSYNAIIL